MKFTLNTAALKEIPVFATVQKVFAREASGATDEQLSSLREEFTRAAIRLVASNLRQHLKKQHGVELSSLEATASLYAALGLENKKAANDVIESLTAIGAVNETAPYPVQSVDDCLDVSLGTILVGGSGCGKTTALQSLFGRHVKPLSTSTDVRPILVLTNRHDSDWSTYTRHLEVPESSILICDGGYEDIKESPVVVLLDDGHTGVNRVMGIPASGMRHFERLIAFNPGHSGFEREISQAAFDIGQDMPGVFVKSVSELRRGEVVCASRPQPRS